MREPAPFSFPGDPLTVQLLYDVPKKIVAGDSIEFLVAIPSDYASWLGSARITGPAQMNATSVATEGADYHVTFEGQSASGTKTLSPGQYLLTVWASDGNNRKTIAQYSLTITENLAVGTPAQSHAVQMLGLIETELRNRVNGHRSIESYTVDGVNITKIPTEQLERMRAKYANEVFQQQNRDAPIGSVKFAFTPTGMPANPRGRLT